MNWKFWDTTDPEYDDQIDKVLEELTIHGTDTEEYRMNLGYLERLAEQRRLDQAAFNVSPSVVAGHVTTLAGILIIVMYEQHHPMLSKALGFVKNPTTP